MPHLFILKLAFLVHYEPTGSDFSPFEYWPHTLVDHVFELYSNVYFPIPLLLRFRVIT